MATVKLTSFEGSDFQLPCQCLYCASVCELRPKVLTLYKSTPVQLLALMPILGLGSAAKSVGVGGILLCFVLSGIALWAGQAKAVLRGQVCRPCQRRQTAATAVSAVTIVVGLGLLIGGASSRSDLLFTVGAALAFGAPIFLRLVTRRGNISLVSRQGQEATIKVSDHLPLVWSASDPSL